STKIKFRILCKMEGEKMGVYIFMDILPHQIDKRKWEKVYHESLQLIRAYPFMDSTVDRESYGVPWKYVQRTDEEEMEIGYKDSYLGWHVLDRKSTRLNSSHVSISYAVFCLKKKKKMLNKMQLA